MEESKSFLIIYNYLLDNFVYNVIVFEFINLPDIL